MNEYTVCVRACVCVNVCVFKVAASRRVYRHLQSFYFYECLRRVRWRGYSEPEFSLQCGVREVSSTKCPVRRIENLVFYSFSI